MSWLLAAAGCLLVIAAMVDLVWTSLWVDGGAAPLTRSLGNLAWRLLLALGRNRRFPISAAGPLVLTFTVGAWIAILWAGWFLIFASDPSAVISSQSRAVANNWDRLYFAGYTLFTLGNGEFQPNGSWWRIATAVAAGSGLVAITLAITYLLSLVSAAVSGRAFAAQVDGLGARPAEAVAASWDGRSYAPIAIALQALSSQVAQLGEQYLAYPVLRYFHAGDAARSPIVALARLEQILAVVHHGVPRNVQPAPLLLGSVRASIGAVLDSLPRQLFRKAQEPLPAPGLDPLRTACLPHVSDREFAAALGSEAERRSRMRGLLEAHGWSPEDLQS